MASEKPLIDTERVEVHGNIADIEYSLNKRCKESPDGGQFVVYWKAYEAGVFSAEKVLQNEARVSFILHPQMDLLLTKISFLKKEIDKDSRQLSLLYEEEEKLMGEIEDLNQRRNQQLEVVIGPYNFCKTQQTDEVMASIDFCELNKALESHEALVSRVEKQYIPMQGLPSSILQRVWSRNPVPEERLGGQSRRPCAARSTRRSGPRKCDDCHQGAGR